MLATFLYKGLGVPQDIPKAVDLAKKAAESHNYLAERCLWLMYSKGEGVPKDLYGAATWQARADEDKRAAVAEEQTQLAEYEREEKHTHDPTRNGSVSAISPQGVAAGALLLLFLFGAMGVASDDSGSTSRGSSPEDTLNNIRRFNDRNCSATGDATACASVGRSVPDHQ